MISEKNAFLLKESRESYYSEPSEILEYILIKMLVSKPFLVCYIFILGSVISISVMPDINCTIKD